MSEESDEKSALVPRLRFPEFRDAAAWKAAQLDKLISTVTPPKKIPTTEYLAEGLFPIIDQGQSDIAGWTDDPSALIKNDEPLIIFGDHTCALKVLREPFAQGADGIKILKGNGPATTEFLYQHLCFRPVLPEEYKRHFSIIRDKVIAYPEAKSGEQQKIADCLFSLDELITAETQKLDALKTHKKGLMQQLFPREGETVPRLRFPEFRGTGQWEEAELGQLVNIKGRIGYRGYTVEDIVASGEGAISLSPSNFTDSGALSLRKATYIAWGKYYESPEIKVERGFTLLVKTGSTYGKAAFVRDLPQECTVNPQIVVLKPTSISPYFLFLLVIGDVIQTRIQATVVGGAIPTLSQESISKFKVRVPNSLEQQRIADCLSSLDDLITCQTRKIDILKTHKKGLMQQLFPVLDEVPA